MNILRALVLLCLGLSNITAQEVNIISYNIRYDNPNDNENWWKHRKDKVVELLKTNSPLSFGVQEAVLGQMEFLKEHLPSYHYVGVGRDDGKSSGEFSAIFYKKELTVNKSGTFWLSPTPEKVSKGWDAALPRVCTYAQFVLPSGESYWHFNTHFDHRGVEARAQSARLIIEKIKELTDPSAIIVLTGDFNTTPDKSPYANITAFLDDAAKESLTRPEGPIGTFSGFNENATLKDRIDYIFTKNLKILRYAHLPDKRDNGLWISDHLPVQVRVKLKD